MAYGTSTSARGRGPWRTSRQGHGIVENPNEGAGCMILEGNRVLQARRVRWVGGARGREHKTIRGAAAGDGLPDVARHASRHRWTAPGELTDRSAARARRPDAAWNRSRRRG